MDKYHLSRRGILKGIGLVIGGAIAVKSGLQLDTANAKDTAAVETWLSDTTFELPALPYAYNALEAAIDMTTMQLHHDKHHAGYIANLNTALKDHPNLQKLTAEELLTNLNKVPKAIQTVVRNNAGGHLNHTWFWQMMNPGGSQPTGALAIEINAAFGSLDNFKAAFVKEGTARFGSGWVWLVKDRKGKLAIMSTPNQDNPITTEYGRAKPLLGNDVWEHAYYLRYQNKRKDYLDAWWQVVNWDFVQQRFAA